MTSERGGGRNLVGVCYWSGQRAQILSLLGDNGCRGGGGGGVMRARVGVRGELNHKRLRDCNAETSSASQSRGDNKRTKIY